MTTPGIPVGARVLLSTPASRQFCTPTFIILACIFEGVVEWELHHAHRAPDKCHTGVHAADEPPTAETLVKTLIDLKQKCIIIELEVREWEGKLTTEKEAAVKAGIAAKKRQADSAKLIRGAFAGMRGPTPRAPLGARSNRPADGDDFEGQGGTSKGGGDRSGEDVLKLLLSTDHVAIGRWPRSTLLADVLVLTRHHTALQERLKAVKVQHLKTNRVKATNTVKATAPQGRGAGPSADAGRLAEDAMLNIDRDYATASLLAAALRDERTKPPREKVVYRDAPQTEAVHVARAGSAEQRAAAQRQEGAIAQYEVMIRTGSCRSAGTKAAGQPCHRVHCSLFKIWSLVFGLGFFMP